MIFKHTLMRGVEQRRLTLGAIALHDSPYTTPISAPVVVYLVHDGKQNKDNAAADNRTSTYSKNVLDDPQLHLGMQFVARLSGSAGRPLAEADADSGAWCGRLLTLHANCALLVPAYDNCSSHACSTFVQSCALLQSVTAGSLRVAGVRTEVTDCWLSAPTMWQRKCVPANAQTPATM